MGGGVSNQKKIGNEDSPYNLGETHESDESFQIVADKFGYYDSTDSEISELHYSLNQKTVQSDHEDLNTEKIEEEVEELDDKDNKDNKANKDNKVSKDNKTNKDNKAYKDNKDETDKNDSKYDTNKTSYETTSSQMSIERKQNSTRYSREPPERDQDYDDNLNKSYCQCRNPGDCKPGRQQDCSPCCHISRKNICHSQKDICPRTRTTYDLAKSAENIRQNDFNRTNYNPPNKQGSQSHSSPEVSKNRFAKKPTEMLSNDNSDFMYTDYMSSRSGSDPMKNRYSQKYPYEEPLPDDEYSNDNHTKNCVCSLCAGRMQRQPHYRKCKCCECMRTKPNMDDQLSSYSDDSQGLNLAYQKAEEYPVLVGEMQNTISQRNKDRVRKTMRQFELLSRQNKGLDKPIYDDDEDENASNRYPCNKRSPPFNRPRSNEANRSYCYDRGNYQTRSECLSDKPAFAATPFPRSRGYVEKVARYMDPSMNDNTQKYPKFQNEYSNSKWQMDPRSGEWVKVFDDNFDFESHYPPLPPTPSPMYRDYDNYPRNQPPPNYYNPQHRSSSPMKHTMNKPCNCRNCMASQSSSRY